MDLLKSAVELIVSGAQRIDVGVVHALLVMYVAAVPVLFLVRIFREVQR